MRWLIVAAPLLLTGCAGPVWLGAALGFGAASFNLDTELVKAYLELREPSPPPASPP